MEIDIKEEIYKYYKFLTNKELEKLKSIKMDAIEHCNYKSSSKTSIMYIHNADTDITVNELFSKVKRIIFEFRQYFDIEYNFCEDMFGDNDISLIQLIIFKLISTNIYSTCFWLSTNIELVKQEFK